MQSESNKNLSSRWSATSILKNWHVPLFVFRVQHQQCINLTVANIFLPVTVFLSSFRVALREVLRVIRTSKRLNLLFVLLGSVDGVQGHWNLRRRSQNILTSIENILTSIFMDKDGQNVIRLLYLLLQGNAWLIIRK